MQILLVVLEFYTWQKARSLTYCAQLAFEEGLANQKISYITITTPWLSNIKKILSGKKFDQVWVEMVHSNLSEDLLDWLSRIAPIRVGFILESLDYLPVETNFLPFLKERRGIVEKRIKFMTHVVACDEKDADDFNERNVVPALWWPQAVPARCIGTANSLKPQKKAVFSGAIYGERTKWLDHGQLKNLLSRQSSSERGTLYPTLFNLMHGGVLFSANTSILANERTLFSYLNSLRYIRKHCFTLWLKGMQNGCAVVNLPHFVKTYAGRVVEGMAAGRPVISWEIPDRPKNKALFENNLEILLFDKDHPEQLAAQIQRLLSDPELNQTIATNALKKIKSYHTVEKRVEQIINWIEKGQVPIYG